jgi:hypothetical protein
MNWLREKIIKWLRVDRDIFYMTNCIFTGVTEATVRKLKIGAVIKESLRPEQVSSADEADTTLAFKQEIAILRASRDYWKEEYAKLLNPKPKKPIGRPRHDRKSNG